MDQTTIKIILADDHELFRDGFAGMLDEHDGIMLVAQAANGEELVTLTERHRPDLVLTDIRMPVLSGIDATRIIKIQFPELPVIALTMFSDDANMAAMLQAGASGYLNKEITKEEIKQAIRVVSAGGNYYCGHSKPTVDKLAADGKLIKMKKRKPETFTPIEKVMIELICKEYTSKQIASLMKMNFRTVEGTRSRILVKMGVKNKTGFIMYALQNGLFDPEK